MLQSTAFPLSSHPPDNRHDTFQEQVARE